MLVDSVLVCGGADTASCVWYWPAQGEGRPHAAPGPRMSRPRYQVSRDLASAVTSANFTVKLCYTRRCLGCGGGAAWPGVAAGRQGRVHGAGLGGAAAAPRHLQQPRHGGRGAAGQVLARYNIKDSIWSIYTGGCGRTRGCYTPPPGARPCPPT